MLNKNQSNKRNYWKYALVLPLLGAFVFFFQVKVIAQEKLLEQTVVENSKTEDNSVDIYKIDKNTTDAELQEKINALKEKYDIKLAFSGVKRNAKNELMAINVELKKGKEISQKMTTKGTEPIQTFGVIISKNDNGSLKVDFGSDKTVNSKKSTLVSPDPPSTFEEKEIFINGTPANKNELDQLDPNEIESVDVTKNSDNGTIRIATKEFSKKLSNNTIYIDDKKVDHQELLQMDSNTIDKMDVNTNEKTIRITTKKNHQTDHNSAMVPQPVPPTPPSLTFKAPKPPVFPKAPKAPTSDPINGDKKSWKDYEDKIEEFNKKMKALEPQMKAFEKQMEEFDKQMEPFNKAMDEFEKKMKTYELQMEKYEDTMNSKKGK